MATVARIGYGSSLAFSTFAGEITSIGISSERDQLDVTHMDSPSDSGGNGFREFIGGLRDPGELTTELNFDATETDPQELGSDSLTITFPDGSTWTWDSAECTGYEVDDPVGEEMSATATWKLSGALVQVAA